MAEIDDKGQVSAEGHYLGRLDGFRFTVDENASSEELKTLRSASTSALQAEFARRADKLYLSPDSEIDVTDQGGLMWGTDAIGRVTRGDDPLSPKITVFVDDMAEAAVAQKVERRLTHWLTRRINALFEPLKAMREDEAISGLAKGVAFRLSESFGVIRRREIGQDIKQLAQEDRALLRKHGVRFGQHFIFMPALLKPAPTRMRLLLWNLTTDQADFAEAPPPGHVTVPVAEGMPDGYYEMAGYAPLNARALRIDMLERLADLIRPMDARAGFEATQDMLSITGCTLEQFADMMGALGFRAEKGERPKTVRTEETPGETQAESTETQAAHAPEGAGAVETPAGGVGAAEVETAVDSVEAPVSEGAAAATPADAADAMGEPAAEPAAEASPESVAAEAPAGARAEPGGEEPATESVAEAELKASPEPAATDEEPAADDGVAAGAAAEPAEGEAKPEAADGESETEVFYTFRLAPRGRPNQGGRRDQNRREAGREGGERRHQGKPGGGKPGRGKGGPKGKRGKDQDQGPRRISAGPPKKDRPVDPDNPFAILQQLKSD